MCDILLAISCLVYAYLLLHLMQHVDSFIEENMDDYQPSKRLESNPEKLDFLSKLEHQLIGWYHHPKLSRFLFKVVSKIHAYY